MDLYLVTIALADITIIVLIWAVRRAKRRAMMLEESINKIRSIYGSPAYFHEYKKAVNESRELMRRGHELEAEGLIRLLDGLKNSLPDLVKECDTEEMDRIERELASYCRKNGHRMPELMLAMISVMGSLFETFVDIAEGKHG